MFVKPVQGKTVLNPENNLPLSQEGSEVEDNQYWQRRLADGDVEEISQKDEKSESDEIENEIQFESEASKSSEEPDKSTPKKSVKKT